MGEPVERPDELADDLRYIAAHEADPRKEERIYDAADELERLRQQRLMILAAVYMEAPRFVAEICDTSLDRSGALLGQVRALAKASAPNPMQEKRG